jgi:hypothetical protein
MADQICCTSNQASPAVVPLQRELHCLIYFLGKHCSCCRNNAACAKLVAAWKHFSAIMKTSSLNDLKEKFDKSRLKVGQKLVHKFHGIVRYTSDCALMERFAGKTSSVFVEHEGEIIEVSLPQVSWG